MRTLEEQEAYIKQLESDLAVTKLKLQRYEDDIMAELHYGADDSRWPPGFSAVRALISEVKISRTEIAALTLSRQRVMDDYKLSMLEYGRRIDNLTDALTKKHGL